MTTPVPWSMKNRRPIVAPGWMSMPVLPCGVLGHHPRDQRDAQAVELVSHAIDGDGRHARVAEDDLVQALGGRVAVVGRLHVLGEDHAAARGSSRGSGATMLLGLRPRNRPRGRAALQSCRKARAICCGQAVVQAVDQVADVVGDVAEVQVLAATVAGIEDLPQIGQDVDDLPVARQRRMAQVVDRAAFLVGLDDAPVIAGSDALEGSV